MTEAQTAEALARWMHRDQVDKSGKPYVEHLERVAAMVSDEAKAAAWLHDILEDTEIHPRAISSIFGWKLDLAVAALTRDEVETYPDYIYKLSNVPAELGGAIAREVKIADLKDNLSEYRRHEGDESLRRRYEKSLQHLEDPVAA